MIAALGLLAGGLGAVPAVDMALVPPPEPGPVCPLLRAELLDLMVPGRVSAEEGTVDLDPDRPFRGAWCLVRTAGEPGTDPGAVSLGVTVSATGRKGWDGPLALSELALADRGFLNSRVFRLPELGPGSRYWTGRDGTVYVATRLATYVIVVDYLNLDLPPQRRVEAAVLAAREVQAKL
ncbi:hypothetical protein Cs7R123_12700 [Catellatospora sp. TT07R-123]|nr:hypothetical protein Cs7R123_12700 [Catellatospora sp. TT07R-123]